MIADLHFARNFSRQARAFSKAPGFESFNISFHIITYSEKIGSLLSILAFSHKVDSSSYASALVFQFLETILFSSGPVLSAYSLEEGAACIIFSPPPPPTGMSSIFIF